MEVNSINFLQKENADKFILLNNNYKFRFFCQYLELEI